MARPRRLPRAPGPVESAIRTAIAFGLQHLVGLGLRDPSGLHGGLEPRLKTPSIA